MLAISKLTQNEPCPWNSNIIYNKSSQCYVLSVTNIHHTKFFLSTIVRRLTALRMLNHEESYVLYSDKYSNNKVVVAVAVILMITM